MLVFIKSLKALFSAVVYAHTRPTYYTKRSNSLMISFKSERVEPVRIPSHVVKRILQYAEQADTDSNMRSLIGLGGVDYELVSIPRSDEMILRTHTVGKKGKITSNTYRLSLDSVCKAMS